MSRQGIVPVRILDTEISSGGVGSNPHRYDRVGLSRRLALCDRVDILHAFDDLPHTVYWRFRKGASAKQMKNWLSPELGSWDRAIEAVPRTCFSLENSALSFFPDPPVPQL